MILNRAILNNLKNPRRGVYRIFSSLLRRAAPVPLATLLAVGNRTPLSGAVKVPTYDGSGRIPPGPSPAAGP